MALLHPESFYHNYIRANGSENLFRKDENYRYFLKQWVKELQKTELMLYDLEYTISHRIFVI